MIRKVLVIDDEPHIRKSLAQLLHLRYKVTVDTAQSLSEARNYLLEERYDMLLVDYNLTDGTGAALISSLSHELPWLLEAKIIFLSGIPYVELIPEMKQCFQDFKDIQLRNKPIKASALYQESDSLLELKSAS